MKRENTKNSVVNKIMSCPKFSVGHLPLIYSPSKIISRRFPTTYLGNDKLMKQPQTHGFTLIELLVVV
ncbi:MAG: type II secretion system GspH family protein, partial [Elusimicrobiaceae bacterium]|nr:type II secretion system GspH family protein [Elusimicrobiaceae bacterium]